MEGSRIKQKYRLAFTLLGLHTLIHGPQSKHWAIFPPTQTTRPHHSFFFFQFHTGSPNSLCFERTRREAHHHSPPLRRRPRRPQPPPHPPTHPRAAAAAAAAAGRRGRRRLPGERQASERAAAGFGIGRRWAARRCARRWRSWGSTGRTRWTRTRSSGRSSTRRRGPSSPGSAPASAPPTSSPPPTSRSELGSRFGGCCCCLLLLMLRMNQLECAWFSASWCPHWMLAARNGGIWWCGWLRDSESWWRWFARVLDVGLCFYEKKYGGISENCQAFTVAFFLRFCCRSWSGWLVAHLNLVFGILVSSLVAAFLLVGMFDSEDFLAFVSPRIVHLDSVPIWDNEKMDCTNVTYGNAASKFYWHLLFLAQWSMGL